MRGLSINFQKSTLVRWGSNTKRIHRMRIILQCTLDKLPTKYLGLPLNANYKRRACWKHVIEMIEQRLSMWKSKLLPKATRVKYINSVLNNLLVFYLSMLRFLDCVERKIISL